MTVTYHGLRRWMRPSKPTSLLGSYARGARCTLTAIYLSPHQHAIVAANLVGFIYIYTIKVVRTSAYIRPTSVYCFCKNNLECLHPRTDTVRPPQPCA